MPPVFDTLPTCLPYAFYPADIFHLDTNPVLWDTRPPRIILYISIEILRIYPKTCRHYPSRHIQNASRKNFSFAPGLVPPHILLNPIQGIQRKVSTVRQLYHQGGHDRLQPLLLIQVKNPVSQLISQPSLSPLSVLISNGSSTATPSVIPRKS